MLGPSPFILVSVVLLVLNVHVKEMHFLTTLAIKQLLTGLYFATPAFSIYLLNSAIRLCTASAILKRLTTMVTRFGIA